MRQAFIYPVELPILTEAFLRRDFNFSMYIGYCITDFLSDIIGFISLRVYFFLAMLFGLYRLVETMDVKPSSGFVYSVPIICLVILMMWHWHLTSVYKYLIAEIDPPSEIRFQVDIDIRDPYDHLNKIPSPPYLRSGYDDNQPRRDAREETDSEGEDSDEEIQQTKRPSDPDGINDDLNDTGMIDDSILGAVQNQKKADDGMFKSGQRFFSIDQNRHERLFWLGKVGVGTQKFIIQGCYITLILWLAAIIGGDGYDRFYVFDKEPIDISIMVISILTAIFIILYYFPIVMFQYVLDTSIQMMKRKDHIEMVVREQKNQRHLRSMRMYQVFKLIRRELIEALPEDVEDKQLPYNHQKLLKENYDLIKDDADEREGMIDVDRLEDFYHLNGDKLKKLESYLLIRKADWDGDKVSYEELSKAILYTTNDVKVDPYDVISRIFLMLANVEYKLSLEQLEEFFEEYKGYFELDDVIEFREEILSLQRGGGEIDIQEIASLIRDDIEGFPR